VAVAGVGLTFGLWWSYFILPSAEVLGRYRRRAVVWGYSHLAVFGSVAAIGAGLRVAAYVVNGDSTLGVSGAVVSIAIPVMVFMTALFLLYTYLLPGRDLFNMGLFAGTVAALGVAVLVSAAGAPLGASLVLLTLSPFVVVLGYEFRGHRHTATALTRALGQ